MFQSFEVLDQTIKAIQNLSLPEREKSQGFIQDYEMGGGTGW